MSAGGGGLNVLAKIGVKQQLLLLIVLLVAPILALHTFGSARTEAILKKHVTNAYHELNKQNLALIGRDIESAKEITSTIIRNPLAQRLAMTRVPPDVFDRVNAFEAMDALLAGYSTGSDGGEAIYYSLYIYDPEDRYFFAPKRQVSPYGVYFFSDSTKPWWYDEAAERKGIGAMRVIDSNTTPSRGKTLAYIRAINDFESGGGVIGVLVASNMERKIGESLSSVALPEGGGIVLLDEANVVLASTTPGSLGELAAPPEGSLTSHGGSEAFTDADIYVVHENSERQKLMYRVPIRSLLQQQTELKRVIQWISVAYLLLCLVVALYFWRSLMRPIRRTGQFLRSYEPGQLLPETPGQGRKDEVSVLISSAYGMARRLNSLVRDKYQMELKQKEAQLQILYQQINPHLLYNTLESIYWKSSLEGNAESAEMIKELSKLMKIGLSRGRELIPIAEELEHAEAYVKLQQLRYDYMFEVRWRVAEDALGLLVPKISLQPLLENAILHGIKAMGEDGELAVAIERVGGEVRLRVEDNGYKAVDYGRIDRLLRRPERDVDAGGYGIRNVQLRARLHFGDAYGLAYAPRPGGGTIATLTIPARKASDA